MTLLQDKVALITGAAHGQGRAHAVTCAHNGADVVLFDAPGQLSTVPYGMGDKAGLEETARLVEAEGRRAIVVTGDVRQQPDLDHAVTLGLESLGKIDILIANAGIWYTVPLWAMSEDQWSQTIDTNLGGVWRSVKAVAPHMMERLTGSIVLVASINGLESGPGYAHYAASKHGVIGFMKSAAVELGAYGIRVNALCPGPTRTPMTDHQDAWDLFHGGPGGTEADMYNAGYNFMALRGVNWLEPADQADVALFLNSDLARRVTGAALPCDAGHLVLPGHNHTPVKLP